MHFASVLAVTSAIASVVSAAEFNITVGKDNQNTFDPPQVTGVQQGDTLRFKFVSKSHSVTQSTFDQPCQTKPNGVDSGFFPVTAGATTFPEWSIQINNVTAPLWFYCARAPHCTASGMVFAVNPTAQKTFDAFKAKATGGNSTATASSSASASASAPSSSGTGGVTAGTPSPGGAGTSNNGSTSGSTTPPSSGVSSLHSSHGMTLLVGAAVLAGLSL